MNLAIFSGRLGRDAELKDFNGDSVCTFSIANEIGTKDNPKAQWIDCILSGKRAAPLQQHLTKGKKLTVSGRVTIGTWRDRTSGEMKASIKLSVNEIELPPRELPADGQPAKPAAKPAGSGFDDMDNDLPF